MEEPGSLLWGKLLTRSEHNPFLIPVLRMAVHHRPCTAAPFSPNIFIEEYGIVLL